MEVAASEAAVRAAADKARSNLRDTGRLSNERWERCSRAGKLLRFVTAVDHPRTCGVVEPSDSLRLWRWCHRVIARRQLVRLTCTREGGGEGRRQPGW